MLAPKVKGMAQAIMRKYSEAWGRTAASAPSRAGRGKDRATAMLPKSRPKIPTKPSACQATSRALFSRPAPRCWATCTEKPMEAALNMPPKSQVVLAVSPTAAVAADPREPTMAVSTYCTKVIISCSTMAGQASSRTAPMVSLIRGVPSALSRQEIFSPAVILRSRCRPGPPAPAAPSQTAQRPRGPDASGKRLADPGSQIPILIYSHNSQAPAPLPRSLQ